MDKHCWICEKDLNDNPQVQIQRPAEAYKNKREVSFCSEKCKDMSFFCSKK